VGITQHARKELGDVVYVQLPKIGQIVRAGGEVAVVESTKAAVDIYSPVSGKIVEVNERLLKNPEELGGASWLFAIELSDLEEVDSLLSETEYEQSL
jgi:glycine cleavage system H protein